MVWFLSFELGFVPANVLLWRALDPRYIDEAQWIVNMMLKAAAAPVRRVIGLMYGTVVVRATTERILN